MAPVPPMYSASLVGAAAAAGICGGLLIGFIVGLLSMPAISRILASSRRRHSKELAAKGLPFALNEKVDLLPVFHHRSRDQLPVAQLSSPQPHTQIPSNIPSTPTLDDGLAGSASRSRQGSLARFVGMSQPSASMEYVSSPQPPGATPLAPDDGQAQLRSPVNFSLPSHSQSQQHDDSTSYARDPYSLRRPPAAAKKKPSMETLPSSTTLVERRPSYALFTRRTSSSGGGGGGGGHRRQPSLEDSSRYAPQPVPLRHPYQHHHHTASSDSSIMALYAAAQRVAEGGLSQDARSGDNGGTSIETPSRRPPLSRAANGSSIERLPSVRKPVPPAPQSRLQPPLSRLSERTNERSMAATTTDGGSSTESASRSLPSKRGILPAEPSSPSWEGGQRHQRETKQQPTAKAPSAAAATPPTQRSPPAAASPMDSRLAALRRLVSDIHNNGSDTTLRSYFSPDTPNPMRKTPGGSLVRMTSYFGKDNPERSSSGGHGSGSGGALETPEPSVQRGSRESPILPRNSQLSEGASTTSRDGDESADASDYAPQPSYEAAPSRIPVTRRTSGARLPLPRPPSLTHSEETVRPEDRSGAGGANLPTLPTASTLVGGDGSQDAAAAKRSPASAYSSLGYGRHLSKIGSFQDYIKHQGGGQQGDMSPDTHHNGVA